MRLDRGSAGVTGVILVYVLYNLSCAALSYPAGAVSDRIDRRHVFGVGPIIFAITYLGFGLATTPGAVWILLPINGAYPALTDGVSRTWVADLAPSTCAARRWEPKDCSPAPASCSPVSGPASPGPTLATCHSSSPA